MRGIIYLEGADCSGKTTLARHLIEHHGASYLHGRVFKHMWRSHVAMTRLALRWADTGLVVIDRLWLSELIYGSVFRGGPAYDLGARCLDRVLLRAGAVTVLCAPRDQERQLARHAERATRGEERFADVRRVVATYADLRDGNLAHPGDGYLDQLIRYGDFLQRHDVLVYDVDSMGANLPLFCARLVSALRVVRGAQVPAGLDSRRYNLTGHARVARWLLVGDSVRPDIRTTRWPFCHHDGLSAATWLNRSLHALGVAEHHLLITNACEVGDDQLPDLLDLLLPVVCLGAKAEARVRSLGVKPAAVIGHPQWYRRFRHHHPEEYVELLRGALR